MKRSLILTKSLALDKIQTKVSLEGTKWICKNIYVQEAMENFVFPDEIDKTKLMKRK